MAIIHQATLSPSKLDVLTAQIAAWPELATHVGDDLSQVGAYRFDDPDGEVGIETHILTSSSGSYLQLPLVYRNEEVPGAGDALLATMEHSVLGKRWIYDACFDPVYVGELARTILMGDAEVAEIVETPDGQVPRDSSVKVRGSGTFYEVAQPRTEVHATRRGAETRIDVEGYVLSIPHLLSPDTAPLPDTAATELQLTGKWAGQETPVVLATLTALG